jgi:hypothetical protein
MGDEYTPSSNEMKHLKMPSRRDMDFLHSYNNEGYMHSNVIDLERYAKSMERIKNGEDPHAQSTDDEFASADDDDHDPLNWKIIIDEEESNSLLAEKGWELIPGEGACEWEMV